MLILKLIKPSLKRSSKEAHFGTEQEVIDGAVANVMLAQAAGKSSPLVGSVPLVARDK